MSPIVTATAIVAALHGGLTNTTADGSDFKGERLTVQFARGPRRKEAFPGPPDRPTAPRPRRTMFRMQISGLPETSWQVSSPNPSPPGSLGPIYSIHLPAPPPSHLAIPSSLSSSVRPLVSIHGTMDPLHSEVLVIQIRLLCPEKICIVSKRLLHEIPCRFWSFWTQPFPMDVEQHLAPRNCWRIPFCFLFCCHGPWTHYCLL